MIAVDSALQLIGEETDIGCHRLLVDDEGEAVVFDATDPDPLSVFVGQYLEYAAFETPNLTEFLFDFFWKKTVEMFHR